MLLGDSNMMPPTAKLPTGFEPARRFLYGALQAPAFDHSTTAAFLTALDVRNQVPHIFFIHRDNGLYCGAFAVISRCKGES